MGDYIEGKQHDAAHSLETAKIKLKELLRALAEQHAETPDEDLKRCYKAWNHVNKAKSLLDHLT